MEELDFVQEHKKMMVTLTTPYNWTPVKEKLPDKDCRCWVTNDRGSVFSCDFATNLYKIDEYEFIDKKRPGFYNYDSEYGYFECYDIIAWMPYYEPEPYKEDKE